ncbi:MAG: tetratricopeptide (TPR) repeat protein [Bradymonadia bacterium]
MFATLHHVRTTILALTIAGCGGAPSQPGPSPDSMRAYAKAAFLTQAGRLDEAAEAYDAAAVEDSTSAEIWLAAAHTRLQLGQTGAAADRAERARQLDPQSPRILLFMARLEDARGALSGARTLYAMLTRHHPEQSQHWRALGDVAERQNDLRTAELAFSEATRRAPDDAEAWQRLGGVQRRRNRPAAAAHAFDQAVRHDPGRALLNPQVLGLALEGGDHALAVVAAARIAGRNAPAGIGPLTVATMLCKRQDLLSAANVLERLLAQMPEHARGRLMLGQVLAQVTRYTAAEEQLSLIPVSGPYGPDALHLRATIALRQGDVPAAISLLEKARQRRPEEARFAVDHARALRDAGRPDEALTLLTQGIDRWPNEPELRFVRAMTMHELGDVNGAVWAMHEVLDVAADHAGALNFIGRTWADEGKRLPDAERMIRAALRQRPEDPVIVNSLGWVLYQQGEYGAARQVLERAAQLAPGAVEVRLHLAASLWALGEIAAAQLGFAAVLDTAPASEKDALQARWRQLIETGRGAPR